MIRGSAESSHAFSITVCENLNCGAYPHSTLLPPRFNSVPQNAKMYLRSLVSRHLKRQNETPLPVRVEKCCTLHLCSPDLLQVLPLSSILQVEWIKPFFFPFLFSFFFFLSGITVSFGSKTSEDPLHLDPAPCRARTQFVSFFA